jgi:hypothetical protein
MCVFALGIEDPLMMAVDRLLHSHLGEIIGPPSSAARVTKCAAAWTLSILCSDFGISFASHAMASASVFSFRPSGNSMAFWGAPHARESVAA